MKKYHSSKARFILSICLAVGAVVLAVGGALAIYTSQVYQRAVVRNRENDVIRFSSDKLYRTAAGPAQTYYYPMSKDQTTMTFSVCNYDQAKNTLFNEKKIDYRITFTVRNGTSDFEYIVSPGNQEKASVKNGNSVTIENNSLPGGRRSTDSYSVSFHENDYGKVEIEVTVTPTDPTATQNRILSAVLIPIEYATTQGVRVHYEYPDSKRSGMVTPDQFDAYNLLVSVSGGEGDVVIAWDASRLDIDPFFVSTSDGTLGTAENGYKTLTVHMSSVDTSSEGETETSPKKDTSTYLITFYNHDTTKPTWNTWTELPISVTLAGTNSEMSGS